MKQLLLLFAAFLIFNTNAIAQNTVKLNINHQLDLVPFAFNTGAQNNLGDDFDITRLEYYLSQFTVVHDGGMETNVNNTYALVDASQATILDLGSHNITSVEAIKFYIGVDAATNHLDPASYDASHALAPKFPSMHWGWSGGYRFVALEGNGSSNYNQTIELHGLDDQNYFQATVNTSAVAVNNEINIDVVADYTRALEGINVNGGVVIHGFGGDAKVMLENFSQYVFSDLTTSTVDFSEVNRFNIFPNPTTGTAIISLEATKNLTYQVVITDMLGREVAIINEIKSNQRFETNIAQSGLYFVQLVKDGQVVITRKLLVQ